ncbi:hypothetical protein GQ54DRAFT_258126 [Martensiomyces pterosporus]|nr:hypothetical protein GQ54DRAFT_258126 [Martensiomyces pterosporus]
MSLFRSSSAHNPLLENARRATSRPGASAIAGGSLQPRDAPTDAQSSQTQQQSGDATYYDVLKCEGDFSTPSAFFSRPLKPAHSGGWAYPWASQPADITPGINDKPDVKHRLRRAVSSSTQQEAGGESVASSSVFPVHADSSLPPSVFRLPGAETGKEGNPEEPWALSGMTAGGRALRRANQTLLSKFDRKVALV